MNNETNNNKVVNNTTPEQTVDVNTEQVQTQESQTVDIPNEPVRNVAPTTGQTEILDLSAITSNVADANSINIVETSTIKGASGSSVIGSIDNGVAQANSNPLPQNIDLSKPQAEDKNTKTKKVKVMSKKDKVISVLVTIFVILVLGASGYSAYYFGYATNPSLYEVKTITLELGDTLPSTVSYYIDSPLPLDDMEYSVDTSQVAYDIVGTYKYSVKHKNVTKTGQVIVKDTKAPELTFKDTAKLVFLVGDKITKDNLVEKCIDISKCEYKLEAEIDTSSAGEKTVNVIATDEKENQKTYTTTVKVYDIQRVVSCESTPILSENGAYTTSSLVELNFDGNDQLVLSKKYKKSTYTDYAAYFDVLDNYRNDETYKFDNISFTYKVVDDSEEIINVTAFNDVIKYYSDNGYTCK